MRLILQIALALCGAASASGPTFGLWHIDGHGYQWQLDRQAEGLPLEPCIRMAAVMGQHQTNEGAGVINLNINGPLLQQFDRQPLVLRMNNATSEVDAAVPRIKPITEANWRTSHMCVIRKSDGTLADTSVPSPWAGDVGVAAWSAAGKRWATSVWMTRLQQLIPNPPALVLRENNEGPRLKLEQLYFMQGVRTKTPDGRLVWATVTTPPEKYTDPPVNTGWLYTLEGGNGIVVAYRWRTDAELDAIDLRAKEWVAQRRDILPFKCADQFVALYQPMYAALWSAFDAHLSPLWRGRLRTCGYHMQDGYHDAGSAETYMALDGRPASLCSPKIAAEIAMRRGKWDAENVNPQAWRELSIRHRGPTVFQSVLDGTGDFVDAESFAGFATHYCWAMQSPGRDVRLTWWESYLTKPDATVIGGAQEWQNTLTNLGRPDLIGMTVGDCEVAIMRRMRDIHAHPTLSSAFVLGETVVLGSTQNDAAVQRVYATLTTVPGAARKLLAVYTPCTPSQAPELRAGEYTVPWSRFAYYLTDPLEALPPASLTLEQRVERLEREVQELKGL